MGIVNTNAEAARAFVDRLVNIEMEKRQAGEDAKESKKDLKTEIDQSYEHTGVQYADVALAAKSRLAKKTVAARRRELDEEDEILAALGFSSDGL